MTDMDPCTYRTSLWTWNEFTIYETLNEVTSEYVEEVIDCGNVMDPDLIALGELLEDQCRALWGDQNPDGDNLADVDWEQIANEWFEAVLEDCTIVWSS